MKKNMIILIFIILIVLIYTINFNIFKRNNNVEEKNDLTKVTINNMYDERIPVSWLDNGIFRNYYNLAYDKLQTLTLDEKIGQLLLVRYPKSNQVEALQKYNFAGYVFYAKDFENKTSLEVKSMISSLQSNTKIPLLTAVDEEGGKIIRISSNPALVEEPFKSSSELYRIGGFEEIKKDTINKSKILYELGLNLNFAPVIDVSTNPNDYMYERTLKENTELTSFYAKTVIEASKGTGVSYTLKHFPGYGNNLDTHIGTSIDERTYNDILKNDLPPFKSGISSGAEAVMVSHNIVTSIDPENPSALSPKIHNILSKDLNFTGVIITDDIYMSALNNISDIEIKALLAGNHLIITTDYEKSFNSIKNALTEKTLTEEMIDRLVFKVLSWKYYKSLL